MHVPRILVIAGPDDLTEEVRVTSSALESVHTEPCRDDGHSVVAHYFRGAPSSSPSSLYEIAVLLVGAPPDKRFLDRVRTVVASGIPILVFCKAASDVNGSREILGELASSSKSLSLRALRASICYSATFTSPSDLAGALVQAVLSELQRQTLGKVYVTSSRQGMYDLGTLIIRAARRRLYVVQRTASLLLGARPYHANDNSKVRHEREFHRTLNEWIIECVEDKSRSFAYLYDNDDTRHEMEEFSLEQMVRNKLHEFQTHEQRSDQRLALRTTTTRHSGPLIVGDDWFAIWVMGERDAFSLSSVSRDTSDELVRILRPAVEAPASSRSLEFKLGLL
jgi:hypothetical protein